MKTGKECARLYCDGASRGNPGAAAIGVALFPAEQDKDPLEYSQAIGEATNNVAEYSALILGLEKSLENNIRDLKILLDSGVSCASDLRRLPRQKSRHSSALPKGSETSKTIRLL